MQSRQLAEPFPEILPQRFCVAAAASESSAAFVGSIEK
jgi:hypothetical protein